MKTIPVEQLGSSDLYVDALYQGGRNGNAGDDPLHKLLGTSIQGGFRYLGEKNAPRLVVLTSSLADPEWPDFLDPETGIFTYFGDNKKPGVGLHETPRFGNELLRRFFDATHTDQRHLVPPILVFTNAGVYRDMTFRGLLVPGVEELSPFEDLVAIWKVTKGERFQNYRAKFSVLDEAVISREWIEDIRASIDPTLNAPKTWREWLSTGRITALKASQALEIRTRKEQLPDTDADVRMLALIRSTFVDKPTAFEGFAAEITRLGLDSIPSMDLTRPSRDGGRDAIGTYQIGTGASAVLVQFAMEAKCYSAKNSVGVKEIARLISRLRHRQFGVLVTTSYVHSQAYREIKEDGHPIVVISGTDIVRTLRDSGILDVHDLDRWLLEHFPLLRQSPHF